MQVNDIVFIDTDELVGIDHRLCRGLAGVVSEVRDNCLVVAFASRFQVFEVPVGMQQVALVPPDNLPDVRKALEDFFAANPPRAFGTGTSKPPPFGPADLEEIYARADVVENQQMKTDLFRLILEIRRLWNG